MERGDVWVVDLEPTVGDEIGKQRPAVVVNIAEVGTLALHVVVPITGWKDGFHGKEWLIRIEPTAENGLSKISAADTFQIRSVARSRFIRRLGRLTNDQMLELAQAVVRMVGG